MAGKERYDSLSTERSQFLDTAVEAARLTLPYLIHQDEYHTNGALRVAKGDTPVEASLGPIIVEEAVITFSSNKGNADPTFDPFACDLAESFAASDVIFADSMLASLAICCASL